MTAPGQARPSTAPGQLLGYGLQYTRLTAGLLQADKGTFHSVEVLDDVAEAGPGGTTLIQSKSALTGNPVADRAIPLWKTLAIWAGHISAGRIDPARTRFEIYVSKGVSGTIVRAFSDASDADSAREALDAARCQLYEDAAAVAPSLKPHAEAFFGADVAILVELIKNFKLVCGSGSPQTDIEQIISHHPVSPSKVKLIADHVCGWVKRSVDVLLERGQPAIISADDFHNMYAAFCRRVDRDLILSSVTPRVTTEEVRTTLTAATVFLRQLEIIDLPYEEKLSAISDCLRARSDRAAWAKAGEVDAASFDDLDDKLKRTWTNEKRTCAITSKDKTEVEHGQLLYSLCLDYETSVQGMEPPPHFIPGCYHELADAMILGWHPRYDVLIAERNS